MSSKTALIRSSVHMIVLLVGLLPTAVCRGDVVILKDGYALHGVVRDEKTTIVDDATGQVIVTRAMNGLDMVDDGPRFTVFSTNYRQLGDVQKFNKFQDDIILKPANYRLEKSADALDPEMVFSYDAPWNANWERQLTFRGIDGGNKYWLVEQQIVALTPHYIRIASYTHRWTSCYLTSELSRTQLLGGFKLSLYAFIIFKEKSLMPAAVIAKVKDLKEKEFETRDAFETALSNVLDKKELDKFREIIVKYATVEGLLRLNSEIRETKGPDPARREKLIRFLIQADRFDDARTELANYKTLLPDETKSHDSLRIALKAAELDRTVAEIEIARAAGRHRFANEKAEMIPKDGLPAQTVVKLAGIQAAYAKQMKRFTEASEYLKQVAAELTDPNDKDLGEAVATISTGLHLDTAARLELFVTLAQQSERNRKAGQNAMPPNQLASAAITGWLQGNAATETTTSGARKILKARKMALDYLKTETPGGRAQVLQEYQKDSDILAFDQMEKLVSLLPPPDAAESFDDKPYQGLIEKTQATPFPIPYLVQLPAEYEHGRSYPLLVVLTAGASMKDALKQFADLPARYGVITAVVDWESALGQKKYDYLTSQQDVVHSAIRHLRRRYQVDSDRIFLFGHGEAANMAIDIATTQPDVFAGLIAINPAIPKPGAHHIPLWHLLINMGHWHNFQQLPVYLVAGTKSGIGVDGIRQILTEWMPKGYPALAVWYKGRGFEFFDKELPYIFDWMSKKTRSNSVPEVGKEGQFFEAVRAGTARFYWLSTDAIDPAKIWNTPGARSKTPIPQVPATIYGKLQEGNRIFIRVAGMSQVTVWLARGMIDFEKPVTLTVNDNPVTKPKPKTTDRALWSKILVPQLSVLMEDLYQRGDRQRPFVQKIDLKLKGLVEARSADN